MQNLKCVGINVNYMNFFQQYETSSVMKIDLCANKNQDQRSEAQTLQNFLCNLGLSKIKHFLNFRMIDSPHYMAQWSRDANKLQHL